MDCCFNKCIPAGNDKKVVVRPNSKTFVTGLASSYDESYPKQVKGRLSAEEWSNYMGRINEALFFYWPCFMCVSFGYCFACCTLGLSLCFPGMRVLEAKKKTRLEIEGINKECVGKGVRWRLVEKCCTSWIEIEVEEVLGLDTDNSQL